MSLGAREEKENSVGWGVREECLKQKGVITLAFTPFSVLVAIFTVRKFQLFNSRFLIKAKRILDNSSALT